VNTAGYWAERHRPNVLIASFKEMKRDLRGTVKQVARFLNVDVDDGVVDEVCRRSTFDYMKANDRKFAMGKMIPWLVRLGSDFPYAEFCNVRSVRL